MFQSSDASVFLIDKSILFCKICEVKFSANKRFTVLQHLKTEKHIRGQLNELISQKKSTAS